MLSRVKSLYIEGLETCQVDVEVDIALSGLPSFTIVGLPDTAVQESKERVRSAIKNSSFNFPIAKIVVNLAPADIKKEGSIYDLPIALGILMASNQISEDINENAYFVGELSLDGKTRPVNGVLPMSLQLDSNNTIDNQFYIPFDNINEIITRNISVYPVNSLSEAVEYIQKMKNYSNVRIIQENKDDSIVEDFSEISGQELAKRALEVSVSGHHNILMIGPPGTGKTMLARRLRSIIPSPTYDESIEITKIYSISGLLKKNTGIIKERPFRSPHHTSSVISIIGGGTYPKPGEISLSHRGILFLDELPEFQKEIINSLRQPLEDGFVNISRIRSTIKYPSKFMLVAAMNPCPCGYYGDNQKQCICSPSQIFRYRAKLNGPIIDRIDIVTEVGRIESDKIVNLKPSEDSKSIRERVIKAYLIQKERYKDTKILFNSELTPKLINKYCKISNEAKSFLKLVADRLFLSGRSVVKLMKVSQTIADLRGADIIDIQDVSEAVQYRHKAE